MEDKLDAGLKVEPKAEKVSQKSYVVLKAFHDKDDFSKHYKVGENVSHLSDARIAELKRMGLVGDKK